MKIAGQVQRWQSQLERIRELKEVYDFDITTDTESLLYRSNGFKKYLKDRRLFVTPDTLYEYCIYLSKYFSGIEAYYDEYTWLYFHYKTRK